MVWNINYCSCCNFSNWPKRFPKVLNKVGSWIGSTKRYFSDIQNKMTKLEEDVGYDPEDKYSKKNNERVENNNDW